MSRYNKPIYMSTRISLINRGSSTCPETPFDDLVEQIDIGGSSLLRAAGKNFRDVMVVVDPADYPRVLEQMARPGGPALEFKFDLMKKAFAHTAQFDALISETLATIA